MEVRRKRESRREEKKRIKKRDRIALISISLL